MKWTIPPAEGGGLRVMDSASLLSAVGPWRTMEGTRATTIWERKPRRLPLRSSTRKLLEVGPDDNLHRTDFSGRLTTDGPRMNRGVDRFVLQHGCRQLDSCLWSMVPDCWRVNNLRCAIRETVSQCRPVNWQTSKAVRFLRRWPSRETVMEFNK